MRVATLPERTQSPFDMTLPAPRVADADAELAELRRQLSSAVRRICPPWLVNDAEDLVQDSLIRVLKLRERARFAQPLNRSYLKKVAYSVMIDEIRRRKRRVEDPQQVGDEVSEDIADPCTDISGDAVIGDAINRCMHKQGEDRRRALTLHFLGHNVTEAASILGCKPKCAENLVYRGLAHLRSCLEDQGFEL